ncbi:MAG: arylesterase [Hyphomonadaceae bacterium]|nr:arylesterase [Hyphomonadaceae bacterium]
MRRLVLPIAGMVFIILSACGEKTPETIGGPVAMETVEGDPSAGMTQDAPVIVMLGDSLTAGFELPAGSALPAALQRDFDARGVKARFVNAGVSGDTTADGLNRYDWSVKGTGANMLVVALGANDFLQNLPPETPRKNLAAILTRAKSEDLPAVLIGVALPGDSQDEREKAYVAIYPDLAAEFGVPYYPNMLGAIAGQPSLLQQDGLHPTSEGVEAMAADITDFLAPLAKDLS